MNVRFLTETRNGRGVIVAAVAVPVLGEQRAALTIEQAKDIERRLAAAIAHAEGISAAHVRVAP